MSEETATAAPGFNKTWLIIAVFALVTAFFFQWKNGLDQASIAETDSGKVVRVKTESSTTFRIFYNGKEKIDTALLCDGDGNVLCTLVPDAQDAELFLLPADAPVEEIARQRFLRIVIPALQADGKPVILIPSRQDD